MKWYLQACPVCGGDLHDDIQDPGWITCFMCARSFPLAGTVERNYPGRDALVGDAAAPPEADRPAVDRKEETKAA